MNYINKQLILAFVLIANYCLAMEKDLNNTEKLALQNIDSARMPLLTELCCKSIADRLVDDLQSGREYTTWFNFQTEENNFVLPQEIQQNILKALYKYHIDIIWKYLPDSVSTTNLIAARNPRSSLELSTDGRFLYTSHEFSRIYDLKLYQRLFKDEDFYAIAISYDNKLIAVDSQLDKVIKLWDVEKSEFLPISFNMEGYIYHIAISPDNKFIAGSNLNQIKIFHIETGECVRKIDTSVIDSIFITKNNKLVVSYMTTPTKTIFNIETGECLKTLEGTYLYSSIFSANGKLIVQNEIDIKGSRLKVLDGISYATLFETIEECSIFDSKLNCLIVGSRKVAYALPSGKIRLLDTKTKKHTTIAYQNSKQLKLITLRLSLDDTILIGCFDDKTMKIWNSETGKYVKTFSLDKVPQSLKISHNNDLIAVKSEDGEIMLWKLDTSKSLKAILEEIKKNINQKK